MMRYSREQRCDLFRPQFALGITKSRFLADSVTKNVACQLAWARKKIRIDRVQKLRIAAGRAKSYQWLGFLFAPLSRGQGIRGPVLGARGVDFYCSFLKPAERKLENLFFALLSPDHGKAELALGTRAFASDLHFATLVKQVEIG